MSATKGRGAEGGFLANTDNVDKEGVRVGGGLAIKKMLSVLLATPANYEEKKYWCYYLHRLQDSVSPICRIFSSSIMMYCYVFIFMLLCVCCMAGDAHFYSCIFALAHEFTFSHPLEWGSVSSKFMNNLSQLSSTANIPT